ncbi:hypothetical protein F53441_1070 [Fusarium austroafricanum]|uniref:Uncharacterized protein n=1 Tax=Fusarium austroafricanum TaxID=2364996 RepID=A0A8H4KWC6_9HYPO|nr:hypothetical protein F53441_1070 [Fusarium austroafricanum]
MIHLLLSHGQDPNVAIPIQRFEGPMEYRALHIADYRLSKDLIWHRADVNALSSSCLTPLDTIYQQEVTGEGYGYETSIEAYKRALLLIRNGGHLTGSESDPQEVVKEKFAQKLLGAGPTAAFHE